MSEQPTGTAPVPQGEDANRPVNTDPNTGAGQSAEGDNQGKSPNTPPSWWQTVMNAKAAEARRATKEAESLRAKLSEVEQKLQATPGQTPSGADQPKLTTADVDRLATQKAEQIANRKAFDSACDKIYSDGKAEFGESFDQVVGTLNQVAGGVMPDSFLEKVTKLAAPAKVLAALGQNPNEAIRILQLSPVEQAMELARLEVKAASAPKQVQELPKPLKPVVNGSGGVPSDGNVDLNDGTVPIDQWMKAREAQWRKKIGA
jgi:hypothetical protein